MINVALAVEGLSPTAPNIVAGNAGQTKDVLTDRTGDDRTDKQLAYRFIQNLDANNDLYYAMGTDCTTNQNNYHGIIPPKTQLSVPTKQRVSCFAPGAWTAAVLELHRVR